MASAGRCDRRCEWPVRRRLVSTSTNASIGPIAWKARCSRDSEFDQRYHEATMMAISRLEQQLGRTLEPTQRNSVSTLNDVTPAMLTELRRLSDVTVYMYLRYHLHEGSETAF